MRRIWVSLLAILAIACGDDSSSSGNGSGTGGSNLMAGPNGPAALTGSRWTSGVQSFDGFELEVLFEFTDDQLVASSICDRSTTVTAQSAVKYTYSAKILEGSANEVSDGDEFCSVNIDSGEFDFEEAEADLVLYSGDESIRLEGAPGNTGIYGEWSIEDNGYVLTWTMGDGMIIARADCPNGLSVETQARARYQNFFAVQEVAEAGDESCYVSLEPGEIEYRIDGNELVLINESEELRMRRD